MANVFLVRHGEPVYDVENATEYLAESGRHQAEQAVGFLAENGLDETTVIFSSTAPRTLETADIIAQGLGATSIVSYEVRQEGEHPTDEVIHNLMGFIHALEVEYAVPEDADTVVLVTHEPLILGVTHQIPRYGEVIKWDPTKEIRPRASQPADVPEKHNGRRPSLFRRRNRF